MDLSAFRPSRIWKRLSPERRMDAAELFWADEESAEQQVEAVAAIAGHMKFRTKSVIALPLAKKARYLVGLPAISDSVAARALVHYHLERQRPMMAAFLDALGITHENGLIKDETVPKPDRERLKAAVAALASSYPAEEVGLYFATLVSQDPDTWGELAAAAEAIATVNALSDR
ncbi:MAG: hypothetical protein WBC51_21950 [Vicinamibacterales bacterium]